MNLNLNKYKQKQVWNMKLMNYYNFYKNIIIKPCKKYNALNRTQFNNYVAKKNVTNQHLSVINKVVNVTNSMINVLRLLN